MEIIVKDKALNEWLENVALAWRAKFPERARLYSELLKSRIETLARPSGMSKTGNIRYCAEIPQELFYVINGKIHDFFKDPANVRKFQEYFIDEAFIPKHKKSKFYINNTKE